MLLGCFFRGSFLLLFLVLFSAYSSAPSIYLAYAVKVNRSQGTTFRFKG